MSAPLLEVRDLAVQLGGRRVVDGISLALERGRTCALVGESGCGKSTTARGILGLVPPSAGEVWFDGQRLDGMRERERRPWRRRIGMVFQDPGASLNPRHRIRDVLAEPFLIHEPGDRSRRDLESVCVELLERVGLSAEHLDRWPHEFSGGQRQRISVARAIALRPDLVVLDEPTSALDVSVQAQILNLLAELQQSLGLAYLFISHDLAVVAYLADEVAVMRQGRILERGAAAAVFSAPEHPYTRALLDASR